MSRTRPIRRAAACGVAIAAMVATAGSGSVARTAVASPRSVDPTAARYKSAAEAEAVRLMTLASLPTGAVRVTIQPVGLTGPAMGTPAMTQLIDRAAYYQIPMTLDQAYAWFQQHPQHGFTPSGTTVASSRSGVSMYGFGYNLSPLPHWP